MKRQVAGVRPIHLVQSSFVSNDIETLFTKKFMLNTVDKTRQRLNMLRQEKGKPGYGTEEL